MRTISVDIRGISFSLKILLALSAIALAWYAWGPAQDLFSKSTESVKALLPIIRGEEIAKASTENMTAKVQGHSIEIDLADMYVSLYDDDTLIGKYEIEKGPKQNAPESVREGEYSVDEKTKSKLSTVTMMRFPFFVQFGDTYALHGSPENASGNRLDEPYEGGLVELSTLDAERVFAFVKEGTSVRVRTKKVLSEQTVASEEMDVTYTELPATSAEAYLIKDMSTGQIFLVKNGGDRYPIASITKLVTALVATDVIGHGAQVVAPNGGYYTLSDLYYPLLLRSDNAVAEGIAEHAGTNFFLSNMNAYVRSIGMTQTSFADASGLSPKNISSALDLGIVSEHLFNEKSFLLDITKEEDMSITSTDGVEWSVDNQNKLASDPYFRGGKLGFTDEAGQTALSIFMLPLQGEVRPVAVIVLRSKDWKQDTRTLLRWLVDTTKSSTL